MKHRAIKYIFFGVLTTAVNFIVFELLKNQTGVFFANVTSVVTAIIFAYFVNAKFVFYSNANGFKAILHELTQFFSARLITMIIEIGGVALFVSLFKQDATFSKIMINIIVLILNYVFSAVIFKKK